MFLIEYLYTSISLTTVYIFIKVVISLYLGLAVRCWVLGTGCWVLDAGYWVLGTGYWVLGTEYWMLGTGYWVLGAGCWMLGAGCWKEFRISDFGFRILNVWRSKTSQAGLSERLARTK